MDVQLLTRFLDNEEGATAIEYGLIAALRGVAIVTAISGVGTAVSTKFNVVATSVNAAH